MRILHINGNYLFTWLHQLMIEALEKCGYENIVFVPIHEKAETVVTPRDNVKISKCFRYWDRLFFFYKQRKIQKAAIDIFEKQSFDLVHAYTLFSDGNCARYLKQKFRIPYVVAVRNTDVNVFFKYMPFLRKRGIKIMQDAEVVFFLSESYRKQVLEKYIPSKLYKAIYQKTRIIPNGIDDCWFERSLPEEKHLDLTQGLHLIYAGRIDKNKNITATQAAMKILRERGYRVTLTVVGKISDQKEWKRILKDEFTTYLPAKPKEELAEIYRQHHIFVMPSHNESFGLVYAEAMSQGLPVIYTKGQGFDGQFPEGMVGYHVSDTKPEEIADAIIKILEDYSQISERTKKSCNKFVWDDICQQYHNVYQLLRKS